MIKAGKYSVKRDLKTYQMDRRGRLRPIMLMNELQAIADTHAEILGAGRTFCFQNEIAWVVTHYLVDIIEMPTDTEEIEILTWPALHNALKAVRDFEIRGADGRLMVRATSQWVLIDLTTRRPMRIDQKLPEWEMSTDRAWDRTFDKFDEFQPAICNYVKPRYDDIDMNQHINNAVYAVWATESMGNRFRDSHELRGLEINFRKEISPEVEELEVCSILEENTSRHQVKSSDIEHASIVCRWA